MEKKIKDTKIKIFIGHINDENVCLLYQILGLNCHED